MQWLFAAVCLINKELKAENKARNFESKRKKAAKGIIAKTSVIRKDTSRSYIIMALAYTPRAVSKSNTSAYHFDVVLKQEQLKQCKTSLEKATIFDRSQEPLK